MSRDLAYKTTATARGGIDDSRVESSDGRLQVELSTPADLGGSGGSGSNAEQLLAAGYAACLLSALRYVSTRSGGALPEDAEVTASVEVRLQDPTRFAAVVELWAELPGLGGQAAEQLIGEAARAWPYAQAVEAGQIRVGSRAMPPSQDARADASTPEAAGRNPGYG